MFRTIIAAFLLTAIGLASVGQRPTAGAATYDIESFGPASVSAQIEAPKARTVDISIQLRGDIYNTVSHAPAVGTGFASWITEGDNDEPLRAVVSFPGSDIPSATVEFEQGSTATWGLPAGGAVLQFDDVFSEAPLVLEGVPAWTGEQEVQVEFGMARTDFATTVGSCTTSFSLLQRVRVEVTPN